MIEETEEVVAESPDGHLSLFSFGEYTNWLFKGQTKEYPSHQEFVILHGLCVFLDLWAYWGGPCDDNVRSAIAKLSQETSHMIAKKTVYKKYLISDHWKEVRQQMLRPHWMRAKQLGINNTLCPRCGKKKSLSVHHRTYENIGRERPNELEPMCAPCHVQEHAK